MTDQPNPVAETKVPQTMQAIKAGGNVAAFRPQNFDEAWRLSNALANQGGEMIPQHYRGQPGAVFAAIAKGAELGMSPMAALATIAVINGRPSLWGDALPALVLSAGHQLEESVDGEGDDMVATATVTRGDTGQKITRTFSMQDAKTAKLSGKPGPWQQYPKRMLQMRARGFAVRDGCADAMVGMSVAEEMRDLGRSTMRDVTPEDQAEAANTILAALPEAEAPKAERQPEPTPAAEEEAQGDLLEQDETPKKEKGRKKSERSPDIDQFQTLADAIEKDLKAALDDAMIDEVLEIYGPQIERMKDVLPDRAEGIDALLSERRETLAA